MRIISKDECNDWLIANFKAGLSLEKIRARFANRVSYLVPTDTGRKTALGRTLVTLLDTKLPGLFWINGFGTWPSSENMELFDGYRRSLDESRTLIAAPAHIFSESDSRQLESILDLTLYFYWDSLLLEGDGAVAIETSHDERISFYVKDRERLVGIERTLLGLELRRLDGLPGR